MRPYNRPVNPMKSPRANRIQNTFSYRLPKRKPRIKFSRIGRSANYFLMKPLSSRLIDRLTTFSLSKYYLHVGEKKNQTHQEFRPFLHGFYNNISLISSNLLLYYLRRSIRFFFVLLMRNYRVCFISQEISDYLKDASILRNYYLVLDYWIPGSATNYRILSKQQVRKDQRFLRRIPQALVTFKLDPSKVYDISQEARKVGLPMFALVDTNLSPIYFSYFLPLNTKSLRAFHFSIFLFVSVLRRSIITKKKKFIYSWV